MKTLQLTKRDKQALLDQAREHDNYCESIHLENVLWLGETGNSTITALSLK